MGFFPGFGIPEKFNATCSSAHSSLEVKMLRFASGYAQSGPTIKSLEMIGKPDCNF